MDNKNIICNEIKKQYKLKYFMLLIKIINELFRFKN